jgi:hypothetical protein
MNFVCHRRINLPANRSKKKNKKNLKMPSTKSEEILMVGGVFLKRACKKANSGATTISS